LPHPDGRQFARTITVTTEDDFQKRLDENPPDWQTRLVFADWLQEQGDPRAEGYRALAACRFVLCDLYPGDPPRYIPHETSRIFSESNSGSGRDYTLPLDWYGKILGLVHAATGTSIPFPNRRAAEDAAARAFATLPARRRAALLKGRIAEPKRKPKTSKKPVREKPAGKTKSGRKKPASGGSGRGDSTPPRPKKAAKRSSGKGRSRG
jgi:uncharacterized protein (TIGR02996 family)